MTRSATGSVRTELGGSVRIASAHTTSFDALTDAEIDAWHRLRDANPQLDSPYFHPGFAAAVNRAGQPVDVIVGQSASGDIGLLLPCHRERSLLRPVGWPGADFQGPVVAPGTTFDPLDLLTNGSRAFSFDHLLDAYPDFGGWVETASPSPYVDTTGGLAGYLGRASGSGKDNMGQARRKAAKAERTHGSLRFAADIVDEAALARVIELKRSQYAATGAKDYFVEPQRVELLSRLLHTRATEFGGVLSTLHAGPHLIAAHFGLRAGNVLHWWFPVYDPEFSWFAPGWILLRELVEASPSLGITRIDFGRGDDEYKRRAKTGETIVNQGIVTRSTTRRVLRRTRDTLIATAKSSPLGPGLRRVARRLR
ncbi:MAG TPA: GNAT family N-acetyltransferase [Micromonosporaceae bacterium]|jgi:CelD/BcsL family acetyltransferase involved in cellulose biosynthesis|nr:GNAT family N-acetyltransferase [Micromonosporaceae bacterium]